MAASRDELLSDPRSGAKPLRGTGQPARPPAGSSRSRPPATSRPGRPASRPRSAPRARPAPSQPDIPAAVREGLNAPPPEGETRPLPADDAEQPAQQPEQETQPETRGGSGSRVSEQVSGSVLAFFVVWPLTINLLRGGPTRMWGWIKAKFANEPYATAGKPVAGQLTPGIANAFGGPPPTPSQLPLPKPIGVL